MTRPGIETVVPFWQLVLWGDEFFALLQPVHCRQDCAPQYEEEAHKATSGSSSLVRTASPDASPSARAVKSLGGSGNSDDDVDR